VDSGDLRVEDLDAISSTRVEESSGEDLDAISSTRVEESSGEDLDAISSTRVEESSGEGLVEPALQACNPND